MRTLARILALSALFPVAAMADSCKAVSAPTHTPVVELFTSEGCNSCPPADRWLSTLRRAGGAPAAFSALAYHVDYWDYIGWTDRFAAPGYGDRHRDLVARGGGRVRYTPQVFVDGQEFSGWRGGSVPGSERPSPARIEARLEALGPHRWQLALTAEGPPQSRASVTVALVENGLESQVTAGENRGERLHHDFVVRAIHDYPLAGAGDELNREIRLPPDANPANSLLVIVLRDAKQMPVQSLTLGPCGA